jgi:hypothetical protein
LFIFNSLFLGKVDLSFGLLASDQGGEVLCARTLDSFGVCIFLDGFLGMLFDEFLFWLPWYMLDFGLLNENSTAVGRF